MQKTSRKKYTVLLGVCAGIAAYKACDLISCLRKADIDVVVCMSKDAHHFITPLTLQTLSANRVFGEMFAYQQDYNPIHISLAAQTDLVLVLPATADIIAKTAHGVCDELLTCTIASTTAPVLFAPAMNTVMYKNNILQANISALKKLHYHFIGPITGRLACGTTGVGHVANTDDILRKAKTLLK